MGTDSPSLSVLSSALPGVNSQSAISITLTSPPSLGCSGGAAELSGVTDRFDLRFRRPRIRSVSGPASPTWDSLEGAGRYTSSLSLYALLAPMAGGVGLSPGGRAGPRGLVFQVQGLAPFRRWLQYRQPTQVTSLEKYSLVVKGISAGNLIHRSESLQKGFCTLAVVSNMVHLLTPCTSSPTMYAMAQV